MLTKAREIVYIAKGSRGVDSRLDGGATPEAVGSLVSVETDPYGSCEAIHKVC